MSLNDLSNDVSKFLEKIEENNPSGSYLRFEQIYDEIKKARTFEDETLSQGVWQVERKKADWQLSKKLCEDVLINKSKDLQIACWYAESLSNIKGIVGLSFGLDLISSLCKIFWESIYPIEDNEYRSRIFEWLSSMVHEQIILIKISPEIFDEKEITYNDFLFANKLEAISKMPGQDSKKLHLNATENGKKTLVQIKKILEQTPVNFFENLKCSIETLLNSISTLDLNLGSYYSISAPSFSLSVETLRNILQIIQPYINHSSIKEKKHQIMEEQTKSIVNNKKDEEDATLLTKDEAYNVLKDLASFLKQTDPHSPSSDLINLIVSWKNKSLINLINDIQTGDTDAHKLLRLFANKD